MGSTHEHDQSWQVELDPRALQAAAGTLRVLANLLRTSPYGVEADENTHNFKRLISAGDRHLQVEAYSFGNSLQSAGKLGGQAAYEVPRAYQDLAVTLQARVNVAATDKPQAQTQYDFWKIQDYVTAAPNGILLISNEQRYSEQLEQMASSKVDIIGAEGAIYLGELLIDSEIQAASENEDL
jgi:hypothetical protein